MSGHGASYIEAAAHGNPDALRLMVTACVGSQLTTIPGWEAMVGAEAFARLLACHGRCDDQFLLAGILYTRAEHVAVASDDRERATALRCEVTDIMRTTPVDPDNTGGLEFLASTLASFADVQDDIAFVLLNELMQRAGPAVANKLRGAINSIEGKVALAEAVEAR